jgi:DNA polymerase III delta prime subunit
MNGDKTNLPWVEKYRPEKFDSIIMNPLNKKIITEILNKNYFPNLLFYGPPGTGKTTTIINLIKKFQEQNNQLNKGLVIHLNASDERGIDIIRNQINQFVNSKSLFSNGTKFVILDEVDYMTKSAQYALRYLFQSFNNNVRFCLICNYISRIDESLQTELMRIRFNKLPQNDIIDFLNTINVKENIGLTLNNLLSIQSLYKSDVRSMVNYMQSNQNIINNKYILDVSMWEILTKLLLIPNVSSDKVLVFLDEIERNYNIEIKTILKFYFNHLIRNSPRYLTPKLFNFIEFIMHDRDINEKYVKKIISLRLPNLLH